jgi:hypothetical protein
VHRGAAARGLRADTVRSADGHPAAVDREDPVVIGVHMPLEFTEKVYEEKREAAAASTRSGSARRSRPGSCVSLDAMFNRVVRVASPKDAAATDPEIRGVLEPVLEDFAFVTPVRFRHADVRRKPALHDPSLFTRGRAGESWTFTGYGAQAAVRFPGKGDEALRPPPARHARCGAKLAAEFHEQAIARGLLPRRSAARRGHANWSLP